jgi:hypothetical protein
MAIAIGTFFVNGGVVAGLPHSASHDVALVIWHFRINGVGAFDTTGIVKSVAVGGTYPQIVPQADLREPREKPRRRRLLRTDSNFASQCRRAGACRFRIVVRQGHVSDSWPTAIRRVRARMPTRPSRVIRDDLRLWRRLRNPPAHSGTGLDRRIV